MTKEEKEQKLYEEWKQRGLERFVPESKLTLEAFRKHKMKFAMQNYSNVDMSEWNW